MGTEKYDGTISGREFLPESGGGVNITGRWLNKRTGNVITVRQSVQDGDNMIIITDKGQLSMEEFSRDYIQASDEVYNESGQVIDKAPMKMDIDTSLIMDYENKSLYNDSSDIKAKKQKSEISSNEQIIKKVFDKLTSYPEVEIIIKWEEFPKAQISTLVDFLDVNIDDISKYIVKKFGNVDTLTNSVSNLLKEKLDKNIVPNSDE